MGEPFHNVNINWDFEPQSKSCYFAPAIFAGGSDVCLSLSEDSYSFYEVCTSQPTNLYIREAYFGNALIHKNIKKPFIFVRNVGQSDLFINASNNTDEPNYWDNNSCQIYGCSMAFRCNYLLSAGEAITLTLRASTDGSCYYSVACFPLGVFYEFTNVAEINPAGDYPACCYYDTNNSLYLPIYTYQDVCHYPTEGLADDCYCKIRTYSFNSLVDNGACLELSFSKEISSTPMGEVSQLDIFCSQFGNHKYIGRVCVDCAKITNGSSAACVISDFSTGFYSTQICSDANLCVLYSLKMSECKTLNYNYCYSGVSGDSQQSLYVTSEVGNCTLKFYGSEILLPSTGYSFDLNCQQIASLNMSVCDCFAVKDLRTNSINRSNLYMPLNCEFPYSYCLSLSNANLGYETGLSGAWISDVITPTGFINSVSIVPCTGIEYQTNKSSIYDISTELSESRLNTNDIQCKTSDSQGEAFIPIFGGEELSFCYSGLEYRYNPLCYVIFQDSCYAIPDTCVNMNFAVSGNSMSFCFPIQATNANSLKITSDFETIEKNACADICLAYSGVSFCSSCTSSNFIDFRFPKLRLPSLSGIESPQVSINFYNQLYVQKNINFYINPFAAIGCTDYALANFLLQSTSQLNSGAASNLCSESGYYDYQDANYNFLMIDLAQEVKDGATIPTGEWCLTDQRILFFRSSYTTPMAYKSVSGAAYNYIMPISTGLNYVDSFCHNDLGALSGCVSITKPTNYLVTGIGYCGGATGSINLTGVSGVVTGTCTGHLANSTFSVLQDKIVVNFTPEDIGQTTGTRCLTINKAYTFSGVQPIVINSNYPLLDMKSPIICENLTPFSETLSDNCVSGIYYYSYDLNNFTQRPLRFLAPDLTYVAYVCWKDQEADKCISFVGPTSPYGQIQKSAAQVCFLLSDIVSNNPYNYTSGESQICINVIGGI